MARPGVWNRSLGTLNLTILYLLPHGRSNNQSLKVLKLSLSDNQQALMLLVPMRLGAETLNPIYASCLKVEPFK